MIRNPYQWHPVFLEGSYFRTQEKVDRYLREMDKDESLSVRLLFWWLNEYTKLAVYGRQYPNEAVDKLFRITKKQFQYALYDERGYLRDLSEDPETEDGDIARMVESNVEHLEQLERKFNEAKTRVDKVLAIDALAHAAHFSGPMVEKLFQVPPHIAGHAKTLLNHLFDRRNPMRCSCLNQALIRKCPYPAAFRYPVRNFDCPNKCRLGNCHRKWGPCLIARKNPLYPSVFVGGSDQARAALLHSLREYEALAKAGKAYPDHRVNLLFNELKHRYECYRDSCGDPGRKMARDIARLNKLFGLSCYEADIPITSRLDKIIAIDAVMHTQHESGSFLTAMYGFFPIRGAGAEWNEQDDEATGLEDMVNATLRRLSKRNPVTGCQTAISRSTPPTPLKWLHDQGLLAGRCLDFGSGRGSWYGMETYDPHWQPKMPSGKFDTIACIYVLNVVSQKEEAQVIRRVLSLLSYGGTAYFAVRRDIPASGTATQRWSQPALPVIHTSKGQYDIYAARKITANPVKTVQGVSFLFHPPEDDWQDIYPNRVYWEYVSGLPGVETAYGHYDVRTKQALIFHIVVKEGFRRQGIGRKLVQAIEAFLKEQGVRRVHGHAEDGSIPFHRAMGYTIGAERRGHMPTISKKINPTATINWNLSDTGMSYYNQIFTRPEYMAKNKGVVGEILWVTPERYFELAAESHTYPGHIALVAHEYRSILQKNVEKLAGMMRDGVAIDLPVVEISERYSNQEGRHRVLAAASLGATKVPVLMVTDARRGTS